jgi:pantoate kinase
MRTFFAPAHITGFFEIKEHKEPLKTGSRGGGIVLESGVDTGVIVKDSDEDSIKVYYDGKICPCKTTVSVVNNMLVESCGAFDIEVHHFPKLPMAFGLGISASGALGTALALNKALELGFDHNKLGEISHRAELSNNTGLGDVSAELSRGLVIREGVGAPGRGKIKSHPIDGWVVIFIIGKPLLTKSVLKNKAKRLIINDVGRRCMNSFSKEPTLQTFMELSRTFTFETGLAQSDVKRSIEMLANEGVTSAMCMLGNAVFTVTDEPNKISKLLDYPSITVKPLTQDIRSRTIHG